MNFKPQDVRTELMKLAVRVARLEKEVASLRSAQPRAAISADTGLAVDVQPEPVQADARPAEHLTALPETPMLPEVAAHPDIAGSANGRGVSSRESSGELAAEYDATDRPPSPIGKLESLVGGRWYAVAGAAIIVVGVAIFLTVAVQRGWLVLGPSYRCLGAAGFGLVLIGAAEWLRMRVNAAASTGLFAAGVSALYAACHVAHSTYHLLPIGATTVLLSIVTIVGIAVAIRAASVVVGALTVGLAFVTPLLVLSDSRSPASIPVYACALLVFSQAIGVLRPHIFSLAMVVGWVGVSVVGSVWIAREGATNPLVALGFSTAVWLLVQAGLWVRARRAASVTGTDAEMSLLDVRLWGDASVSFFASCWALAGCYYVTHRSLVMHEAIPPFGLALGAVMIALTLAGHIRLLTDLPRNAAERLGVSLTVQAGSLIVAGFALALPAPLVSLAWLALGAGAIVGSTRLRTPGLLAYGCVVLALATGRTLTIDALSPALRPWVDFAGLHLSLWNAVAGIAGVCWLMAARAGASREGGWRFAAYVFAAVATLMLMLGCASRQSDMRSLAVATGLVSILVGMGSPLLHRIRSEWVGMAALVVPTVLWVATYGTLRPGRLPDAAAPLAQASLWIGLVLAGVAFTLRTRLGRGESTARLLFAAVAFSLILGATSMEVARCATMVLHETAVRRAAVSVWWGVFAVAMVVAGFVMSSRKAASAHGLRVGGLGLLGAAAVKAVAFDLGGASALARAGSLVGLGLLMLGVAAAYAMARKKLSGAGE